MFSKIFGIIWAVQCAVGNSNFAFKFVPPNQLNLTLKYEQFSIVRFKYNDSVWITAKNDSVITLSGIQPCTRYNIQAIISGKSGERNQTSYFITDIESKPVNVTASQNSIKIDLLYTNIDCINNVSVIIDNSTQISYRRESLSRPLIIPDLSPCVNYSVRVSLNHKSGSIVLYNDYVTTESTKLGPVENFNYNKYTKTLTWSFDQSGNCSTKFEITIKTGPNIKLIHTSNKHYLLNLLNPCSNYLVSIKPWGHDEYSRTITFKTGYNIPATPIPPKMISTTKTSLEINSSYVASDTDKCQIEMFHFNCYSKTANITRSIYNKTGYGNMKNLKSNTSYQCNVLVKNGKLWSKPSENLQISTTINKNSPIIELYTKSVSSTSIHVSWTTSLTIKKIRIESVPLLADVLPPHCTNIRNQIAPVEIFTSHNESNKLFNNLEPYTNYSIQLFAPTAVEHIYETTSPGVPHQVLGFKIASTTSVSVTVSFELPCIINGHIEQLVGKLSDSINLNKTNFLWKLPFNATTKLYTRTFNYKEYNILPGHKYKITVGIQLDAFMGSINESTTDFTPPASVEPSNSDGILHYCVIVVVIIFVVLLATTNGVGVWYYNKLRENQNATPLNSTYIEMKCFATCYKQIGDACKSNEFDTIEAMSDSRTLGRAVAETHGAKNRYADIMPYDYNRVVLAPNEYCTTDYINASYIDGYKHENQYIATQGPTERTVYEFWQMVIEKKCNKIIMLTRTVEGAVGKCFQYFPLEQERLKFDDIVVRNIEETDFGNFIRRELVIGKGIALRSIIHYQYVTWPDRDCPKNELDLIEFIDFTKSCENKSTNPMIVHCSAGVGRTGTFIALDILLQGVRNNKFISVYETVKKLRLQRCKMVQTSVQYQFVYAAINKYYLRRVYKGKESE